MSDTTRRTPREAALARAAQRPPTPPDELPAQQAPRRTPREAALAKALAVPPPTRPSETVVPTPAQPATGTDASSAVGRADAPVQPSARPSEPVVPTVVPTPVPAQPAALPATAPPAVPVQQCYRVGGPSSPLCVCGDEAAYLAILSSEPGFVRWGLERKVPKAHRLSAPYYVAQCVVFSLQPKLRQTTTELWTEPTEEQLEWSARQAGELLMQERYCGWRDSVGPAELVTASLCYEERGSGKLDFSLSPKESMNEYIPGLTQERVDSILTNKDGVH